MQRCLDLGHVFRCPRHPERFCQDKHGKSCVLCIEAKKRSGKDEEKEKRGAREAEVAAALAARAESLAERKMVWNEKLPTVNKLAKSAANKAQQAVRASNRRNMNNRKGLTVRKEVSDKIPTIFPWAKEIEISQGLKPDQI